MCSETQKIITHWVGRLAVDPSILERVRESFVLILRGDDASSQWLIDMGGSEGVALVALSVEQCDTSASISIELTEQDFLSIAAGDLNPQLAYATGRLRVRGQIEDVLRCSTLFAPELMSTTPRN